MLLHLALEVGKVDVPRLVAADDDDAQAHHLCARRIGAVRRGRNQADIALGLAARGVIVADGEQAGVFTLCAGIRLQRHARKAGDLGEHLLQLTQHRARAARLLGRRERMQRRELGPRERHQLRRGVQLHGARAERNHAVHQREIAVFQALQVPHHFRLGVIAVEHRMRQHRVAAAQLGGYGGRVMRQAARDLLGVGPLAGERFGEIGDIGDAGRLVAARGDVIAVEIAQVDALRVRAHPDRRSRRNPEYHRIEERVMLDLHAACAGDEQPRHKVSAGRNAREPLGAVVDGVEARHIGEQRLRRADVARRLLAPDVLLAGLQRHAQRRTAGGVARHANDPSGHRALMLVAARHEGGVRAAVAERHAEALRRANGDVGAVGGGRTNEHQRQQIGADGDEAAGTFYRTDRRRPVAQPPIRIRVLEMRAEHRFRIQAVGVADHDVDAEPLGARAHHGDDLRMHGRVDEECLRLALRQAPDHGHGFRGRGGFIEQRGVGHRQTREVDHHLLEIEQRLQPALRDLGLIGRIGGVPAGVLEHIALDHRRRVRAVVPHADVVPPHLVVERMGAQLGGRRQLGARLAEGQRLAQPDAGRHYLPDQRLERVDAERGQHFTELHLIGAEMAARELVASEQGGELAHTPAALAYSSLAISSPSSFFSFTLSLKSQPFP